MLDFRSKPTRSVQAVSANSEIRRNKVPLLTKTFWFRLVPFGFVLAPAAYLGGTLGGMDQPGGLTRENSRSTPVAATVADNEDAPRSAAVESQHPLEPALQIARANLQILRSTVRDYTAVIVKRERVNGELTDHQFLEAKIRNRQVEDGRVVTPFSVYLLFRKPESLAGREVIWVEGKNDNRLIAHEGGFKNLLTVKLKPDNILAMFGQRYPITEIGIENLIVKLIEKGERDMRYGECNVRIFEGAKVSDRVCTMIQVEHPVQRSYFDFYRARVFIDDALELPIRYCAWSWPETEGGEPVLEEEYTYLKLRTNVGLTDRDFDPENISYQFP
jgi:hypothetical protein